MTSKKVFICADHGLAVFYFLQSDIVDELLQAGVEVILLTEDHTVDLIRPGEARSVRHPSHIR